jgi:CBS domain-containing protein
MELAKNLKIESVARLKLSPPEALRPTDTVADAVKAMQERGAGCVLICTEGPLLQGIFTERDLMTRVLEPGRPLSMPLAEVMTPEPIAVHRTEPIASALRLMQKGNYRHLPVVDESGAPVGLLSVKRIINYMAEHFPATIYNLPPTPALAAHEREGA